MAETGQMKKEHHNPCAAAVLHAASWYQLLNGKTKLIVQVMICVVAIVSATLTIEGRFAKAADMMVVQQSTEKLVTVLTINYTTRKAILALKKAKGTLTAEEQVELTGIVEILAELRK
jgi:hypothetical protein